MISKEQFIKIINRLRNYNDLQDKIQDLFRENIDNQEMDFMNSGSICIGHETIVVQLLENMFNDRGKYISWYLFEQDYGRTVSIDDVFDKDTGKFIDLSTPEKLYDYLVKEMEEKQ
ncbi:MAG: hypothetical protein HFJ55_04335 [Clostridia bacterium]|nr:hypothetical protein [Clostridia bacterium]